MTNPSPLPITVDGTRLDTLAYNIESLTGVRSMPRTRSGDVVVPGLHGVVPSLYDDYEAGELALRMWVRDTDEDGKAVLTDVHRKQQLDRNLDRLFALFRSGPRLLDVRMATGRDTSSQYQVLSNQRMDVSDATSPVVIRTNTVPNPSFEFSTGTTTVRTNEVTNPSFETGTSGWTGASGTLARSTVWKATGHPENSALDTASGELTASGSAGAALVYSRTFTPVAGAVYNASAMVASGQTLSGFTMRLVLRWYNGATLLQTDTGPEVEVAATGKPFSGSAIPVFVQAITAGVAPASVTDLTLSAEVVQTPAAGSKFYADTVLVERSPTLGDYFDGASGTGYTWSGTANLSTSLLTEPTPDNWGVNTPEAVLVQHTKLVGPLYGSALGELRILGPSIPPDAAVIWQGGTRPNASASPSGQWSASIQVRSDNDPCPRIRLRITGLDAGGAPLGYARTGSASGPEAVYVHRPDDTWHRMVLEGVYLPAGSVTARLEIQAEDELSEGVVIYFESAILEPNPTNPRYFDGDTGGYVWDGTPDNSTSSLYGASVSGWSAVNGSFTVRSEAPSYPVEFASAHGVWTTTADTGAHSQRIFSPMITPAQVVRPWVGGVWVWGRTGVTHAILRADTYDATSASTGTGTGPTVAVSGGWTWVPLPPWTPPSNSAKIRFRLTFYGGSANQSTAVNSVAWVSGAMLATADGPAASAYTPTGADYWDELSPGAIKLSSGPVRRLPQVRQAWCKTADAVVPQVEGTGTYVARLSVLLEIPAVFWQDPVELDWSYTAPSTKTWTREVTNLRGSTAPIEDAVVIVYGPATNPKVTDPASGAWVRLNMTIPAGQAWLIDAGRDKSAVGGAGLSPTAANWSTRRQFTDWTSPRSRLFVIHPQYDSTRGDHVVRITVQGAAKARVIARRKWL